MAGGLKPDLQLACIYKGLGVVVGVGLGLGVPQGRVSGSTSTLSLTLALPLALSLAPSRSLALCLRPGGYALLEGLAEAQPGKWAGRGGINSGRQGGIVVTAHLKNCGKIAENCGKLWTTISP